MSELNINFEYDGVPLKSSNWQNCLVAHERGWCGVVVNEKYNDAPEVEVDWFGNEKGTATSRTSMIFIRPFILSLYDKNNTYICSKELVEWLYETNRMFSLTLRAEHIKIKDNIAYPINFIC